MAKCPFMESEDEKARSAVGLKRMVVYALVGPVDDSDSRLASIFRIKLSNSETRLKRDGPVGLAVSRLIRTIMDCHSPSARKVAPASYTETTLVGDDEDVKLY